MTYSYTQLSQYLACPRRYRYRYLDGWQEKDTRANLLFGRAFEKAMAAYFSRKDCAEALFREWAAYRETPLTYSNGDGWDRMLEQGIQLLERFAQDDRVRIRRPRQSLQVRLTRQLSPSRQFVAYVDAMGQLDGIRHVIDWKTTTARYPEEPEGLLALDPQLVCYSWLTGEPNVAFVVFVRKRQPEIQYLKATITDEQREGFGALVQQTIEQIEGAHFPCHGGIRFPQNTCLSCPHMDLCLGKQDLIEDKLIRRPGGDLGLFDELTY